MLDVGGTRAFHIFPVLKQPSNKLDVSAGLESTSAEVAVADFVCVNSVTLSDTFSCCCCWWWWFAFCQREATCFCSTWCFLSTQCPFTSKIGLITSLCVLTVGGKYPKLPKSSPLFFFCFFFLSSNLFSQQVKTESQKVTFSSNNNYTVLLVNLLTLLKPFFYAVHLLHLSSSTFSMTASGL